MVKKKQYSSNFSTNISLTKEGEMYYQEQNYRKALDCFEKAILIDKRNVHAYIGKADCLRKQERHNKAVDVYKQALYLNDRLIDAYNGICESLFDLEKYAEALASNDQAINTGLANAKCYNLRGQILKRQEHYQQALSFFFYSLEISTNVSDLIEHYRNRCAILLQLGRTEEAFDAKQILLTISQQENINLGYDDTYVDLQQPTITSSTDRLSTLRRAFLCYHDSLVLFRLGLHNIALASFDRSLLLDPENYQTLSGKGYTLLKLNRYEEAKAAFHQSLFHHPQHILSSIGLILAYFHLRQFIEAKKVYTQASFYLSQFAEQHPIHSTLEKSLTTFVEAFGQENVNQEYTNLENSLSQYDAMIIHQNNYNQSILLSSQIIDMQQKTAEKLLHDHFYEDALYFFQKILLLAPAHVPAFLNISTILFHLNSPQKASLYYEQLKSLASPTQISDHYWLWTQSSLNSLYSFAFQSERLKHFIQCSPTDNRTLIAFEKWGQIYPHIFGTNIISNEERATNIQALQELFACLPGDIHESATRYLAQQRHERIAELLVILAPPTSSYLDKLANEIVTHWKHHKETADIAFQLYKTLEEYHIPSKQKNLFLAHTLQVQNNLMQAEEIFLNLSSQEPNDIDILWDLIKIQKQLQRTSEQRIAFLKTFINHARTDKRYPDALTLMSEIPQDTEGAIEIANLLYQAHLSGIATPLVHDYSSGNWDAICALHTHPHYAYPAVVVVDTENEYIKDAPLGSCMFEIGAVRYKGNSKIDKYNAVIQRDFNATKVANRQEEAKPLSVVVKAFQDFIDQTHGGKPAIIGHNMQAFDAPHLRAIGIKIDDDQIIDTLTLARYLHPDSLYHNLEFLCDIYGISFVGTAHNAIPDAQACAQLCYKMGEMLVHNPLLLPGFRAFVIPESTFDKVILQPYNVPADPHIHWELTPEPTKIAYQRTSLDATTSPLFVDAFSSSTDSLIEYIDSHMSYAQSLPEQKQIMITVHNHNRIEHILSTTTQRDQCFVLPNPDFLLCPGLLRQYIEQAAIPQLKLELYCLYQASHNHDAHTLYPYRISTQPLPNTTDTTALFTPNEEQKLENIRQILHNCCCKNAAHHPTACQAHKFVQETMKHQRILIATHEIFLKQQLDTRRDMIIVDNLEDLQMHFAEYLATTITSEYLKSAAPELFQLLHDTISSYCQQENIVRRRRERLSLRSMLALFTQPQTKFAGKNLIAYLQQHSPENQQHLIEQIAGMCQKAQNDLSTSERVQAYWLDLWYTPTPLANSEVCIEKWQLCEVDSNLKEAFHKHFLKPYTQHILCGKAITIGHHKTRFITRFFGLSENILFKREDRQPSNIYFPQADEIRPASFLARRSWAEETSKFLYKLASSDHASIMVTLSTPDIAEALSIAFDKHKQDLSRQVLSPYTGWSSTAITKNLTKNKTITILSPQLRKRILIEETTIEAIGPLRFLNQQDPLVNAHIRALSTKEGPISSYLLPQALLELKSRLATSAKHYIILDGALNTSLYRDEVHALLADEHIKERPLSKTARPKGLNIFSQTFTNELEQRGYTSRLGVTDDDLYQTLKNVWSAPGFRKEALDQETIIKNVLNQEDQLVVAATGGGKSLCFQLPAILLGQDSIPKVTLIVSPLISLMKDQVQALHQRGILTAITLDSTSSEIEQQNYIQGIQRGDYSIIYIAPEKIHTQGFRRAIQKREVGLIAFDEAHCISEWGHDFRTDYFNIKKWIDKWICGSGQRNFPIIALTATARTGYSQPINGHKETSTITAIIQRLGLKCNEKNIHINSPQRPELKFEVLPVSYCPDCGHHIEMRLGNVKCKNCSKYFLITEEIIEEEKCQVLADLLNDSNRLGRRWKKEKQRGIIYCRTVKHVRWVQEQLNKYIPELRVGIYHGQISPKEKRAETYQKFIQDNEDRLDIIIATNAFGMGIDVRKLGFIIHFDIPASPEAYYQEAGRAGRDDIFKEGKEFAHCILLYHQCDLSKQRELRESNRITEQQVETTYKALHQLRKSYEDEILAQISDIKLLTGIDNDKESNKIQTILYYLENHTNSGIARGENASTLLQLGFEVNYQALLHTELISPIAQELLEVFCDHPQFKLLQGLTRVINLHLLSEYINKNIKQVRNEITNLVKRGVLTYRHYVYIQCQKNKRDALATLSQTMNLLWAILKEIHSQHTNKLNRVIDVDLVEKFGRNNIPTENYHIFEQFMKYIAKTTVPEQKIFSYLKKSHDQVIPMHYKITFEGSILRKEDILKALRPINDTLKNIINKYVLEEIDTNKWQAIDLLSEEPKRDNRSQLQTYLLLLQTLGIFTLHDPEESTEKFKESAIHITFKKHKMEKERLSIDLYSLRLLEKQRDSMLQTMQRFAEAPEDQRVQLLHSYFAGDEPLIQPFKFDTKLTKEQREIAQLENGYHLVLGPAGSGKTKVLCAHVQYLVDGLYVPQDHILVTTQYHSANDAIGNSLENVQIEYQKIKTSTINEIGESIFRRYMRYLKRSNKEPFYDEQQPPKLIGGTWKKIEQEEKKKIGSILSQLRSQSGPKDLLESYWPETFSSLANFTSKYTKIICNKNFEQQCYMAIKRLRQAGIFPSKTITKQDLQNLFYQGQNAIIEFYYAVYILYTHKLVEDRVYTYDDQILFSLTILKENRDLAPTYEHIIIDEIQDLTPAQIKLLHIIGDYHRNIIAFGDDSQDIRIKETRDRISKKFQAIITGELITTHHLTVNFRSMQEILDFAHSLREEGDIYPPKAYYGSLGIKPTAVYLTSPQDLEKLENDITDDLLDGMVDTALSILDDTLTEEDKTSVAFMVAKSSWLEKVQSYLRTQKNRSFSVLDNKYSNYHILNHFLAYFRLIINKKDEHIEDIIRYCIEPQFDISFFEKIKQKALFEERPLIEMLIDRTVFQQCGVTKEQEEIVQQHINISYSFKPEDRFEIVWQAIRKLPQGKLQSEDIDGKFANLEETIKKFNNLTIVDAINEIDSHISFLEENKANRDIIITTIDNAKSQAFHTVILLGAEYLRDKNRWYVSASRAKRKFFFLMHEKAKTDNHPILSKLNPDLYDQWYYQ